MRSISIVTLSADVALAFGTVEVLQILRKSRKMLRMTEVVARLVQKLVHRLGDV